MILLPVTVYILIVFLLSAFFTSKALVSYSEYSYCGRSLTIVFVFFTYLGTWIGGGTIVGLAEKSYINGASQYWMFGISCVSGILFVLFFNRKIRRLQVTGVAEMLALRFPEYGGAVRIPAAIAQFIRNVTVIGMNFVAMAYMLSYFTGIDYKLAALITLSIVVFYTALSGLWGVVVTDLLQGFLQTLSLLILIIYVIRCCGSISSVESYYASIGKESALSLFGYGQTSHAVVALILSVGLFFLMGDSSDWERIYSCKTDKTAFWGYLIPLTITLLLLLFPTYVGVFLKSIMPDFNASFIIYYFVSHKMPRWVSTTILLGLLSSVLSTADSFMMSSGVIISNDIIKKFLSPGASDRELIFWTRISVILTGTFGFAFALNFVDIMTLWITGVGVASIILLPEYFAAWFSKRMNTTGALTGMWLGFAYCIILLVTGNITSVYFLILGILMNFFISMAVSLFTARPDTAVVRRTWYWDEYESNYVKKEGNDGPSDFDC